MYEVFNTLKKGDDTMVLVEGSPGIGKTTFCLKISYDWTNEKIPKEFSFPKFDLMLLLKCRDIHGDIMEAISEQLLPEDVDAKVKKEMMDYIKDIHNQENILIILDGLDELPKIAENHMDNFLHRRILPFCYVLATSRQERGITVRQEVDFATLLQIEGFTKEDAFDYIRKHFSHFGAEHLQKGERLINAIKENTFLHALPSNPLNLLLLCVVFEDYQGELPSLRTELYQIIVRCILRRYCAKHNLKAPDDDQALEKQFEDSLLALGELAWRCLREGRHSFREEELVRFESSNKTLAARNLGLVFKEASVKRIKPQHEYHFFHKTFQEYLAASYLAHKLLKEQVNVLRDLKLTFYEGIIEEYRQVFLFVSGILGEDASVFFGQFGEILKSEDWDWHKCSEEEASFFIESFNESRNAEQLAIALCSFIPFPLTLHIDDPLTTDVLRVVNACKHFSRLQHPLHLIVIVEDLQDSDGNSVVDFIASCSELTTLSLSVGFLSVEVFADSLCTALSGNLTLSSFTAQVLHSTRAIEIPGYTLAASKTSATVTFKLANEHNDAWAINLATGLSPTTPLTSVVFKIYGSVGNTAIKALKSILSNRSLTSLGLIIYGEMTDSQAAAVGEGLAESILKSLTLIVFGKLSYVGAVSLKKGFKENTSLNSLKVKVFGELPDNWATITENELMEKKSFLSLTVHPNIAGKITTAQVVPLCPGFKLQSLTLNLWGELRCNEAETLCKRLVESSTSCVTLNIHGRVTDDVADCFLRYLKLCKTLSFLRIKIWGELTRDGNSALQELCNQRDSFSLSVCRITSDDWICKELDSTINFPSSLTPVFTKVKETLTSKLSLNITNHGDATGDWGHGLRDGLANDTSLTTLNLTFNDCSDMSEDWGRGLGDGLAKNTSLTTLSLTFNNDSDMSGDWARLGDGLAKNTSLTTLSLTFDNSDMSEDWGRGLGDGLAKNTSLTTLSLTYDDSVASGDWGRGLGDGLAKNTSLTTLSLTFNDDSDMSEDWARGLGDGLAKNTSLTTLSLTFNSKGAMSGDLVRDLGDGLAKNTSLTTLSLTFNGFGFMSGDWARGLGDGLSKNTSLTTLSLIFDSYSFMSGNWGRGLGEGLSKNTSLTTLRLTFHGFRDMSLDWGRGLGDGLAKNTSLATLSLTFNSHSEMRGDWARGLSDGFAKNTSITTLSLAFNNYTGTRGDWLNILCDSLAKSESIATLSFTINDYSDTSNLGCDLGSRLAKCKSLTTLNLTLGLYGEAILC